MGPCSAVKPSKPVVPAVIAVSCLVGAGTAHAAVLWKGDFETGDVSQWDGSTATHVIVDSGPNSPAQNTFGGYMMGTLDVPPSTLNLTIGQPNGPGTFRLENSGLIQGSDSFNAVSLEPAPSGPGTGPGAKTRASSNTL